MKVVQCENCKSIDLVKRDGLWVCQSCGTQFENDVELNKVSIDYSEDLQRLYKAARMAKDLGNYDGAQHYYDEILGKNPDSWEAVFNTVYLRFMQCTIAEIDGNAMKMQKTLPTVIRLVHQEYESDAQDEALVQIEGDLLSLNALFEGGSSYYRDKRQELANNKTMTGARIGAIGPTSTYGVITGAMLGLEGLADSLEATNSHNRTRYRSAMMLVSLGDSIEQEYDMELVTRAIAKGVMLSMWRAALIIGKSLGTTFDLQRTCESKIKKWDHTFKTEDELAAQHKIELAKKREEEKAVKQAAIAEKKQKFNDGVKKHRIKLIVAVIIIAIIAIGTIVYTSWIVPKSSYDNAIALMQEKKYSEAYGILSGLGGFSDADAKLAECSYNEGLILFKAGNYDQARKKFVEANGFGDANSYLDKLVLVPTSIDYEEVAKTDSHTWSYRYEYDDHGRMIDAAARVSPDGSLVKTTFSEDGAIQTKQFFSGGRGYTADSFNYSNPKRIVMESGRFSELYDEFGNHIADLSDGGWKPKEPARGVDEHNNPSGGRFRYEYDEEGNLVSASDEDDEDRGKYPDKMTVYYSTKYFPEGSIDKDLIWRNIRLLDEYAFDRSE